MELTDKQIEIIRESYQRLIPEVDRVSLEFYKDLFGREPKLKAMFRDDLEEQGMRFMSAIGVIVENLDDPTRLKEKVDLLSDGHAAFGIKPEAYRSMEEALVDTFAHALGEKFTNPVELAWRSAFRQICDAMIEKTRQAKDA